MHQNAAELGRGLLIDQCNVKEDDNRPMSSEPQGLSCFHSLPRVRGNRRRGFRAAACPAGGSRSDGRRGFDLRLVAFGAGWLSKKRILKRGRAPLRRSRMTWRNMSPVGLPVQASLLLRVKLSERERSECHDAYDGSPTSSPPCMPMGRLPQTCWGKVIKNRTVRQSSTENPLSLGRLWEGGSRGWDE